MARISKKSSQMAAKRKIEVREKLWPDAEPKHLWDRRTSDGYATVPRTMPLIMGIMNDLADKGKPVGSTYFELWCRLRDESYLNLSQQQEMAFSAGFTGQRSIYTWRDRLEKLQNLKFLDIKSGANGNYSYALFWNPYHIIRYHQKLGNVPENKWQALIFRASEIGAFDLDDDVLMPFEDQNQKSVC